MSHHYSPEFLAVQKTKLQEQKSEVEAELSNIARFDEASGSYVALQPELNAGSSEEIDESGMESETAQTNMAVIRDLETTLNDTLAALSKLESGDYGRCEATGEWIDEDRLSAYPAARTIANI